MTIGVRSPRSTILVFLRLVAISGADFAGDGLFDDDYSDYPFRTRLRDGQISGLSVSRASDHEDEVNVSWTAIDPASWGLGFNAYRASLVVILDDGGTYPKTLLPSSMYATPPQFVTDPAYQAQLLRDIVLEESSIAGAVAPSRFGPKSESHAKTMATQKIVSSCNLLDCSTR